jgi:phosphatidylserine/phosphatidylglycerophosphate/cardiolipin synthase-like enzyme
MPWHDVHLQIMGPSAADVDTNFVERYEHIIRLRSSSWKPVTPLLMLFTGQSSALSKPVQMEFCRSR